MKISILLLGNLAGYLKNGDIEDNMAIEISGAVR